MKTGLVYLTDAYQTSLDAQVVTFSTQPKQLDELILTQTIFYPQGGGQPADTGTISGSRGTFKVKHVLFKAKQVVHQGKLEGSLSASDKVSLHLDWPKRFYHMRLHTAGHVLHEAVTKFLPELKAIEGVHGIGKQNYLRYQGIIDRSKLEPIQDLCRELISQDLPVTTQFVTFAKLQKLGIYLPENLPRTKPLRIVQIGDFDPMPDGGTQLHSTAPVTDLTISDITYQNGHSLLFYQIPQNPKQNPLSKSTSSVVLKQRLSQLKESFTRDLNRLSPAKLQTKYLSKKGLINGLTSLLPQLPPSLRASAGKDINSLKQHIQAQISSPKAKPKPDPASAWLDVTHPGQKPPLGRLHPVSQAIDQITHIFESIGFTRVRYPEVDWDYYVFEALNMPADHPARDEWETFFVQAPSHTQKGRMVLSTHTSNGQVREMERLGKPPIRMLNIAKCYRRQQDVTHTSMFHQFEGLVVDEGINIQHLKGTLDHFARQFYGPKAQSRIRPFMFKFTEPSFEVDFSCTHCQGKGCRFCKAGWHEVGGAGMVHPNVLKAGGIDPEKYTGFAFGWGIERVYTLRPGLKLDDIRPFYQNNLDFLSQF